MINRNKRITVTAYSDYTEDDYGDITGQTSTSISFWAKVRGKKSKVGTDPQEVDRKYQTKMIEVICRTADITNVDIDDELTIAGNDSIYQINDVYEADFLTGPINYSVITAEENN